MPRNHRAAVGPARLFEAMGRHQLDVLLAEGLHPGHRVLDVGCGCLRAGRHLILYLDPDGYCGVDPDEDLVRRGLGRELPRGLAASRRPRFLHGADFPFDDFGVAFDYVLAQSIFTHLGLVSIARLVATGIAVLRPGGLLAATFIRGTDPDFPGWSHAGVGQHPGTLARLGREAGCECTFPGRPTPNGQSWIFMRKTAMSTLTGNHGDPAW